MEKLKPTKKLTLNPITKKFIKVCISIGMSIISVAILIFAIKFTIAVMSWGI